MNNNYAQDLAHNMKPGDSVDRSAWLKSTQAFRVDVLSGLHARGLYLSMDETRDTFPVVSLSPADIAGK